MRLNRRVPVSMHGGVRGRLSIQENLLLAALYTNHTKTCDFLQRFLHYMVDNFTFDLYNKEGYSITNGK